MKIQTANTKPGDRHKDDGVASKTAPAQLAGLPWKEWIEAIGEAQQAIQRAIDNRLLKEQDKK